MPPPRNTPRYGVAQMIDALRKARGIKAVAARSLGCDRVTVVNYCNRYPSIQAACDEQRQILVDVAEGKLTQEVDAGSEWAVKLVLTTLGKDRGYVTRHENTGKDGEPLPAAVTRIEVIAVDYRQAVAGLLPRDVGDTVHGDGEYQSAANGRANGTGRAPTAPSPDAAP